MPNENVSGAKEVVLRLDEATAEALWKLLYSHGELVAAGVPVMPPAPGHEMDLAGLMEEIDHQLGRMTIAEAMQASIDRKTREQGQVRLE
jgi:hypothetical protein